jgi:hypothetical protein
MDQQQPKRTTWITIRMSEEEHFAAEQRWKETTCKSLSEYARKAVLGKPVVMNFRNRSLDDFNAGMIPLQNELNAIGKNFNQLVRRLHTLKQIPDIREWVLVNEEDKTRLFRQIETISNTISKAYQLWLRDYNPPPTSPESSGTTRKK